MLYRFTETDTRKENPTTSTRRYRNPVLYHTGLSVSVRSYQLSIRSKPSPKSLNPPQEPMGPKRVSRAEKGKGKATGDEPPRRRTRSVSVVIREPTDEIQREEPREEPRKNKSRQLQLEPGHAAGGARSAGRRTQPSRAD
ncbi:unnamed protein product [Cochlearia groenlandica]